MALPHRDAISRRTAGFTLLELGVVLLIIGVVIGGGLTMFTVSMQKRQMQETQFKLAAIQKALYDYRIAFNRIPCPADANQAIGSQYYGVEAQNPGTCLAGTVPSSNYLHNTGSYLNVEGLVPVATLGLPDDYAFDGWGRRIWYAVTTNFTQSGAFNSIAVNSGIGGLTVNSYSTTITNAAYILLSNGPDGHGAFTRGGVGASRLNAGITNAQTQQNCDCDSNGTYTLFNSSFIQRDVYQNPSNVFDAFDDVVVFGTRMSLAKPSE